MADDRASEVVSGMTLAGYCCCLFIGLLVGGAIFAFVLLTVLLVALG